MLSRNSRVIVATSLVHLCISLCCFSAFGAAVPLTLADLGNVLPLSAANSWGNGDFAVISHDIIYGTWQVSFDQDNVPDGNNVDGVDWSGAQAALDAAGLSDNLADYPLVSADVHWVQNADHNFPGVQEVLISENAAGQWAYQVKGGSGNHSLAEETGLSSFSAAASGAETAAEAYGGIAPLLVYPYHLELGEATNTAAQVAIGSKLTFYAVFPALLIVGLSILGVRIVRRLAR